MIPTGFLEVKLAAIAVELFFFLFAFWASPFIEMKWWFYFIFRMSAENSLLASDILYFATICSSRLVRVSHFP
jgi:hypothetical protein